MHSRSEKKSSSVCDAPLNKTLSKTVLSLDNEEFRKLLDTASKPEYSTKRSRRASTEEQELSHISDFCLSKIRQETQTEEDMELRRERAYRHGSAVQCNDIEMDFIDSDDVPDMRYAPVHQNVCKFTRGNEEMTVRELNDELDLESGTAYEDPSQGTSKRRLFDNGNILGPQFRGGFSYLSGDVIATDKLPFFPHDRRQFCPGAFALFEIPGSPDHKGDIRRKNHNNTRLKPIAKRAAWLGRENNVDNLMDLIDTNHGSSAAANNKKNSKKSGKESNIVNEKQKANKPEKSKTKGAAIGGQQSRGASEAPGVRAPSSLPPPAPAAPSPPIEKAETPTTPPPPCPAASVKKTPPMETLKKVEDRIRLPSDEQDDEFVSADEGPNWPQESVLLDGDNYRADDEDVSGHIAKTLEEGQFITVSKAKAKKNMDKRTMSIGGSESPKGLSKEEIRRSSLAEGRKDSSTRRSAPSSSLADYIDDKHKPTHGTNAKQWMKQKQPKERKKTERDEEDLAPLSVEAVSASSTPMMSPSVQLTEDSPRTFSYADAAKKTSGRSSRQDSPVDEKEAKASAPSESSSSSSAPSLPGDAAPPPAPPAPAPDGGSTTSGISFFYEEEVDDSAPRDLLIHLKDKVLRLRESEPPRHVVVDERHAEIIRSLSKHWQFFTQGNPPVLYIPKN